MFLGIDCGTQGTKALLVDEQGKVHGRGYAPHDLIQRPSGAREQQPQWWIDALRSAVKQAVAMAGSCEVRALAVSGQQHGLVVLEEQMRVIRPAKLWNDTETAQQNAQLIARLGGEQACFEKLGIVPLTGYTASKLLWLKQREPEHFARIRHILLPHDYLNLWLTGELRGEYGDASGTGYFEVRSRSWSGDALAAIDGNTGHLLRALPRLADPNEIIGTVRPEVAAELGLAGSCLVATGGGDNMMGAIGTGNVAEGVVTLSLGTSATVYSFRSVPETVLKPGVAQFCSSSGGWLPLVCTMNATNVVTQTLELLGHTVGDIEEALVGSAPGADGLTFIPFLNGERTPDLPQARGSLAGASASNFTASNLLRAAIEGASFGILDGLELILGAGKASRILLIGGGARSPQWRQLIADASGTPVEVPLEKEAGCLGAAMQAIFASQTESFEEIARRCVSMDATGAAVPNRELKPGYAEARAAYRRQLEKIYKIC
jgi:xylulokinase